MKPVVLLTLLLIACALPALAEPPATRARILLTLADDPVSLRARLLAFADSAGAAGDHLGAGEALGYAGTSFQREGRLDSAIVCHRRAFQLLGSEQAMLALVDQLLLRRAAGDASEAIRLLTAARANSELAQPPALVSRIAWAYFLQGRVDTAAKLFAPVERLLLPLNEWRFRMARVAFTRKDYRHAVDLLLPVAVRSRGTDDEVVEMLEQAGKELGVATRIQATVFREVDDRDRPATALATALGGQLISLTASDGFPLGGLLVPAPAAARHAPPLLTVLLLAPGDTLGSGDSLAFALHRHGLAILMLYPRGYGASVAPSCPSPDGWFDRQAALQARIARDVRDTFDRVRPLTPVDSTAYVVAAAGASATMAVEAAVLDSRVRALLLVSPAPEPVDRGLTRARLTRLDLPVFFQIAPDDHDQTYAITDALYQAGNRPASRVVEAAVGGQRLVQFRSDPALAARFLAWLDATVPQAARATPRTAAPRPTPPAPRR
jgi:tetratricopeptide (TPR) repeat protein